jgi:hypothetical protein
MFGRRLLPGADGAAGVSAAVEMAVLVGAIWQQHRMARPPVFMSAYVAELTHVGPLNYLFSVDRALERTGSSPSAEAVSRWPVSVLFSGTP